MDARDAARARGAAAAAAVGVVGVIAVLVVGAAVIVTRTTSASKNVIRSPPCRVAIGPTAYHLEADQAANATTVAAVGKRLGLADHAVTIALAAALQESGLHNLTHGDRDSLGLFQQRPSQGWGTPQAILVPRLAAARFYERLAQINGWRTLSVSAAAQEVQRSAAPSAYADWESEARSLAQAMTGESTAGLTCRFASSSGPLQRAAVDLALANELGPPGAGSAVTAARGWTIASWLVGHAEQLRISTVAFAGRTWVRTAGTWQPAAPAGSGVTYG